MSTNKHDNAIERLQQFEIKLSLQRIAIMNYLMENFTHPSVDTIFSDLFPVVPTLSKTTVYNTLKLFVQQGAVLELNIDEKNLRYDVNVFDHAHFKCKQCGCIFDVPVENPNVFKTKQIGDFLITETQLYYRGYCAQCNPQQPAVVANEPMEKISVCL